MSRGRWKNRMAATVINGAGNLVDGNIQPVTTTNATGLASCTVPAGEIDANNVEFIPFSQMVRDPYHAEEITFGLDYGNMVKATQIHEYINRFAKEHNAALLQMQPTTPGAYLFVWEMQ